MRLAILGAHMSGSYATNIGRFDKPFNPMLGETYEMVTPEFRFLAEAVSHHPAVMALQVIGDGFEIRANNQAQISFNGREVKVNDVGEGGFWHIRHPNKDEPDVYNHKAPVLVLGNLFIGEKFGEPKGRSTVTNIGTGEYAELDY